MAADGLRVALTDDTQLREWVNGRAHWVVLFGREFGWAIDDLDAAIGVYPTCPTVVGQLTATFVPKQVFPLARMRAWCKKHRAPILPDAEHDILVIADTSDECVEMLTRLRQAVRI